MSSRSSVKSTHSKRDQRTRSRSRLSTSHTSSHSATCSVTLQADDTGSRSREVQDQRIPDKTVTAVRCAGFRIHVPHVTQRRGSAGMKPTIRRNNQTGHIQHQGDHRQERRRAGGLAFAHVLIRALMDLEHRPTAAIHNHATLEHQLIITIGRTAVQIIAAHDMEVQHVAVLARVPVKVSGLTLKRQLEANRQRHPLPRVLVNPPLRLLNDRNLQPRTLPQIPLIHPRLVNPPLRLLNNRNLQPRIVPPGGWNFPERSRESCSHCGRGSRDADSDNEIPENDRRSYHSDEELDDEDEEVHNAQSNCRTCGGERRRRKTTAAIRRDVLLKQKRSESSTVRKEFLDECRRLFKKTLKVKNDADYAYYEGATAEEINSWVANQGPGPSEENLKLDMEGGVGSEWNAEVMHILMDKLRKYCLANKVLKKNPREDG
ncbi:hypothetical protein BDN71DRAFT_1437246, partial [Pleurotus eryngii]